MTKLSGLQQLAGPGLERPNPVWEEKTLNSFTCDFYVLPMWGRHLSVVASSLPTKIFMQVNTKL